jgi:hypothetical protein
MWRGLMCLKREEKKEGEAKRKRERVGRRIPTATASLALHEKKEVHDNKLQDLCVQRNKASRG